MSVVGVHRGVGAVAALLAAAGVAAGLWAWRAGPEAAPAVVEASAVPLSAAMVRPQPPAAATAEAAAPRAAASVVKLLGIEAAASGRDVALLCVDGGPTLLRAVGDHVAAGIRVAAIGVNTVQLQRGAAVETLVLQGPPKPRSQRPRVAEPTVIAAPADQPPPNSSAVGRAIERARRGQGGPPDAAAAGF